MAASLIFPILGTALDLLLCDPPGWPHPTRLLGAALDRLERLGAGLPAGWPRRVYGGLCLVLVAGGTFWLVRLLLAPPVLGALAGVYLAYAGLALGGLLAETDRAAALIASGDLEAARAAVAMLVSRETADLDEDGLRRALAETLAENCNDAFVAPFFWLALGGPALLWAYKAVSTMDSMWGYKTERFRDLGLCGARADDALAFIPARLTALALAAAASLSGRPIAGLWGKIRRDAQTTASPNAGWPMAAGAWCCGATMGGPSRYFGRIVDKPVLGPASGRWDADRLRLLRGLGLRACLLAAGLVLASLAALGPLWGVITSM